MPPSRGPGTAPEASTSRLDPMPGPPLPSTTDPSSSPPPESPASTPVRPKSWVHFAAGGLGGMCGAIVTAPFDLVKTRLQSSLFRQQEAEAKSLLSRREKGKGKAVVEPATRGRIGRLLHHFVETGHILRDVYVHEGPRALFRGLGPTLVGVVPARSINFFTYGNCKPLYSSLLSLSTDSALIHLSAAATAGLVTATATNPIWVVKTRLQLQQQMATGQVGGPVVVLERGEGTTPKKARGPKSLPQHFAPSFRTIVTSSPASSSSTLSASPPSATTAPRRSGALYVRPFRSSWECIIHIWRTEGLRGFYRGLSASYLGVAEGTIQWTLYERFKMYGRRATEGDESWWTKVGAAGGAKLVATGITYPHEVVRTRMRQTPPPPPEKPKYTGLWTTFRVVLAEEGVAAFYGGLSPHLLRVVPNAAVMYTVYEAALAVSRKREASKAASETSWDSGSAGTGREGGARGAREEE